MLFSLSHQHQHLNSTELSRARSLGGIEGVKLHPRAQGDPSHHFFLRKPTGTSDLPGGVKAAMATAPPISHSDTKKVSYM